MSETQRLLDQMIEDNRVALAAARDKLNLLQNEKQNRDDGEKNSDQDGLEIMKRNLYDSYLLEALL